MALSFLPDWLTNFLYRIGLFRKHARLAFLGLDNAGKTTLLGALSSGIVRTHVPTLQPNYCEYLLGNLHVSAHDLGGHQGARRLWKEYISTIDAVVFVVDALDRSRFEEARQELNRLLMDPESADKPVLVLGNKIDMAVAAGEEELRYALGLQNTTGRENFERIEGIRPIELFMCSAVRQMGYAEGFQWLNNFL